MTEKEYRAEERDSYSSIKKFAEDRVKYFRKYVLKDKSEIETPSTALLLGSLVDCMLFSNDTFEEKFKIANCLAPTGQIGEFTEELCTITLKSLNGDLVVTRDLVEMMEEAFNKVKYDKGVEVAFKKKDFKWLLANFIGTPAEDYYKECRLCFGKQVVDMNLINAANKVVNEMRECEWTKNIVNATTTRQIEVLDQLIILFDLTKEKEPFKAMLDRVIIDHTSKTITPYDLKVTYSGEEFPYNYWKMKYYLQVASYHEALVYYVITRPELKEYEILPISFIVASSNLMSNPLIYKTSTKNLNEALFGFTMSTGKKVKGLYELVGDVSWHKSNKEWRNSREVYENKGVIELISFDEN